MIKKLITFLISAFALLLLISCVSDSSARVEYEDSPPYEYYTVNIPNECEQLEETDFTDEYPGTMISEGICLENIPDRLDGDRMAIVAIAVASPRDQIIHVGETVVSRTGVAFTLENRTDLIFFYGAPWDLASYTDGRWMPVRYQTEAISWTAIGITLPSGDIRLYRIEWEHLFGELPPGRYMFIRGGRLGERHQQHQDRKSIYALAEFVITADCPKYLPPAPDGGWQDYISFVKYKDVTPNGMTIVAANASDYDIDFSAYIDFIVPQIYVVSDNRWDWWHHFVPRLPTVYYLARVEGFCQRAGSLNFFLTGQWNLTNSLRGSICFP